MAKFVCPFCEEEIQGDDENQVSGDALDHLIDEHDKEHMTEEYVMGNIHAHD